MTRVLAVESELRLRALAAAAARASPVPVEVTGGTASALPAADASYDAAVVSFVLCTVPDQRAALADIRRVLRPDGRLCFLERVRAHRAARSARRNARIPAARYAVTVKTWLRPVNQPGTARTGSAAMANSARQAR